MTLFCIHSERKNFEPYNVSYIYITCQVNFCLLNYNNSVLPNIMNFTSEPFTYIKKIDTRCFIPAKLSEVQVYQTVLANKFENLERRFGAQQHQLEQTSTSSSSSSSLMRFLERLPVRTEEELVSFNDKFINNPHGELVSFKKKVYIKIK